MFGYVRPYKSELLVKEYEQYKAIYCQLCRTLEREYGWLAKFALSYDCTFYAMLSLAVTGAQMTECKKHCVANPLKPCRYLEAEGESYKKAAALSVLLTYHKLRDDAEDEGFWKKLGCRLLLPVVSRKARTAGERYPFLEKISREAMEGQQKAEAEQAGPDPCAEPTAHLLSELFRELSQDPGQAMALGEFGYYLGRWIYLMDAADDLEKDLKEKKFNPLIGRLGLEGKTELTEEARKQADEASNAMLNATMARMLPPLNLLELENFGPIIENVARKGLPEIQREILFLHIREKRRNRHDRSL